MRFKFDGIGNWNGVCSTRCFFFSFVFVSSKFMNSNWTVHWSLIDSFFRAKVIIQLFFFLLFAASYFFTWNSVSFHCGSWSLKVRKVQKRLFGIQLSKIICWSFATEENVFVVFFLLKCIEKIDIIDMFTNWFIFVAKQLEKNIILI